jgi:hypothetical protein
MWTSEPTVRTNTKKCGVNITWRVQTTMRDAHDINIATEWLSWRTCLSVQLVTGTSDSTGLGKVHEAVSPNCTYNDLLRLYSIQIKFQTQHVRHPFIGRAITWTSWIRLLSLLSFNSATQNTHEYRGSLMQRIRFTLIRVTLLFSEIPLQVLNNTYLQAYVLQVKGIISTPK